MPLCLLTSVQSVNRQLLLISWHNKDPTWKVTVWLTFLLSLWSPHFLAPSPLSLYPSTNPETTIWSKLTVSVVTTSSGSSTCLLRALRRSRERCSPRQMLQSWEQRLQMGWRRPRGTTEQQPGGVILATGTGRAAARPLYDWTPGDHHDHSFTCCLICNKLYNPGWTWIKIVAHVVALFLKNSDVIVIYVPVSSFWACLLKNKTSSSPSFQLYCHFKGTQPTHWLSVTHTGHKICGFRVNWVLILISVSINKQQFHNVVWCEDYLHL